MKITYRIYISLLDIITQKVIGIDNDFYNPYDTCYEILKGNPCNKKLSFLFIKSKIPFVTSQIKETFEKVPTYYVKNILNLALSNNKRVVEEITMRFAYAKDYIINKAILIDLENDKNIIERFLETANQLEEELNEQNIPTVPKIHGNIISVIASPKYENIKIEITR